MLRFHKISNISNENDDTMDIFKRVEKELLT